MNAFVQHCDGWFYLRPSWLLDVCHYL